MEQSIAFDPGRAGLCDAGPPIVIDPGQLHVGVGLRYRGRGNPWERHWSQWHRKRANQAALPPDRRRRNNLRYGAPKPGKEKRRFRGKTDCPRPSHVKSGPDPALYFAGKNSGRPCVPEKLLEEPGTSGQPAAGDRLILPALRLSATSPPCRGFSGSRVASGVCHSLPALSGLDNDCHHGALSERVINIFLLRWWAAGFPNATRCVWGPFFQGLRPRRASLGSYPRMESPGPKQRFLAERKG
jgi:hypothetical protein